MSTLAGTMNSLFWMDEAEYFASHEVAHRLCQSFSLGKKVLAALDNSSFSNTMAFAACNSLLVWDVALTSATTRPEICRPVNDFDELTHGMEQQR